MAFLPQVKDICSINLRMMNSAKRKLISDCELIQCTLVYADFDTPILVGHEIFELSRRARKSNPNEEKFLRMSFLQVSI